MLQYRGPCVLLLALAGQASAQWTATRLHTDGTLNSTVNALTPGRFTPVCAYGGWGSTQTPIAAGSLWDSASGTNVPVTWYGATTRFAVQEFGTGQIRALWQTTSAGSFMGNAAIWTNTRTDLAPPGALLSEALAAGPNVQTGWVEYGLN